MQVVYWGTYDKGKPRNRIMIQGLRSCGVEVEECSADPWIGVEDKSQIKGWKNKLRFAFRWLNQYPGLIRRYLQLSAHDVVVVGYMGQLDVMVLQMFAKIRKIPVAWDAFLSLYSTVVEDRKMLPYRHPAARLLYAWEYLACRAADIIVLDTKAHSKYFIDTFHLPADKVKSVFVGAETEVFKPNQQGLAAHDKFNVLFYGQFTPLHGIETIVKAAWLAKDNESIRWTLIGKGQESKKIRSMIANLPLKNLEWIDWIPYEQLPEWIHSADICLGIFGTTDKAQRIIPNKVFQILAADCPLITADTPAIRELVCPSEKIKLIPPDNAEALYEAVLMMKEGRKNEKISSQENITRQLAIGPEEVGKQFKAILVNLKPYAVF